MGFLTSKSKILRNSVFTVAIICMILSPLTAFAGSLVTIEDEAVPLAPASVLIPQTGSATVDSGNATIDHSNTSEGYVMVRYSGGSGKVKVQIAKSGGATYTYNIGNTGSYAVFPLTAGDGSYTVNVYENVSGNQYALACGTNISISLRSSTIPFLYPSQYVNFNANSTSVQKGVSLAQGAADQIGIVSNVYNYVISNIKYDDYKASTVTSGYLPNVDSILASGKGICFDYAALMATMLRTQQIPTQLRVGYVSGGVYHAWISVYLNDVGWVNDVIYFDGTSWKMMDPTFASSGGKNTDFVGNGTNYSTVYVY